MNTPPKTPPPAPPTPPTPPKSRRAAYRLGRGLDALFADAVTSAASDLPPSSRPPSAVAGTGVKEPTRRLPLANIHPNPYQPRRQYPKESLQELAQSLNSQGLLQPILVRPQGEDSYHIIAGQRRWNAAKMAGWHEIEAIVRPLRDDQILQAALVENIQREDLAPMDEALAYQKLSELHSHDVIARAVGKSRSHITNTLRLLTLPAEVQAMLEQGALSAGHARALIGTEDPLALARQAVAENQSVRVLEQRSKQQRAKPRAPKTASQTDPDIRDLETSLSDGLGMPVRLRTQGRGENAGKSGQLTIRFASLAQLDELCKRLRQR
ncbi:MAG: ParB/RepB/Spo0J family partition protein [Pseudomonadota bacterium]